MLLDRCPSLQTLTVFRGNATDDALFEEQANWDLGHFWRAEIMPKQRVAGVSVTEPPKLIALNNKETVSLYERIGGWETQKDNHKFHKPKSHNPRSRRRIKFNDRKKTLLSFKDSS